MQSDAAARWPFLAAQVDEVIEQRPPPPGEEGTLPGGDSSPASVY